MDGSHVNEETVTHLRQRLNVMREIVKVRLSISSLAAGEVPQGCRDAVVLVTGQ